MGKNDEAPNVNKARRLLDAIGTPWSTLSGVVAVEEDESVLNKGRRDWHAARSGKDEVEGNAPVDADGPVERRYRFFAALAPWRLRLERIGGRGPLADEHDLVIVRGTSWWTVDGGTVVTNEGNPAHEAGTFDLSSLLRPTRFLPAYDFLAARRLSHEGRTYLRVHARPLEDLGLVAPELVVLGADHHELLVDMRLGVVVRWEVKIGEQVARRDELSQLSDEDPVVDSVFDPPAESSL